MMIDEAGRQVDYLGSWNGDPRLPRRERIAQDPVGISDIEVAADQHDAKWRVQVIEQHALELGNAVAVGVSKKCNPVRRSVCAAPVRNPEDEIEKRILESVDRLLRLLESLD